MDHELEFLYTAEGTALCLIGTSKIELHKGCGIFINSGVLHRFEAQSSTFAPNIVFSPTLLAPENSLIYEKYILPVISSSVPYQVFSPSNTFGKQVLQLLSQICTIQETKPDNELCTIQLLFQLWNILQKNMDWTSDSNSIHRLNHKQARLQAMMQYIHDHYMEEITLETIAASASISKSRSVTYFSIRHTLFAGSVSDSIQAGTGCQTTLYYSKIGSPPLQMKPDLQVPATFAGSSDSIIIGVQRNTERKKRKKVLKVCFINYTL